MTDYTKLIKALRWCQTHGCSKCVALLDTGSCKYGGAIKIFEAAADALERLTGIIDVFVNDSPEEDK